MIVQEQSWESVREELTSWERRVVARPRGGLRVQLVSPGGKTFTTTNGLTSFLGGFAIFPMLGHIAQNTGLGASDR